jgi:hypothetical protein
MTYKHLKIHMNKMGESDVYKSCSAFKMRWPVPRYIISATHNSRSFSTNTQLNGSLTFPAWDLLGLHSTRCVQLNLHIIIKRTSTCEEGLRHASEAYASRAVQRGNIVNNYPSNMATLGEQFGDFSSPKRPKSQPLSCGPTHHFEFNWKV